MSPRYVFERGLDFRDTCQEHAGMTGVVIAGMTGVVIAGMTGVVIAGMTGVVIAGIVDKNKSSSE